MRHEIWSRPVFLPVTLLFHPQDVKLKSFDKILVPVHMTNHWFLYEMDVKSKEIRVVDSIAKAGIGEKQEEHIEVEIPVLSSGFSLASTTSSSTGSSGVCGSS